VTSLGEALGYPPDACLLIVTCDELGVFHAGNAGVYSAIREGMGRAAGLVVPGPWAREAAARCPSLLDGDGGFPRTVEDLWDHADTDEVRRECRAQIERAIYWGFDVSHLSCHLGALESRPEFFDVALELATEFELPLRLPDRGAEARLGFPIRELSAQEGVISPDYLIRATGGRSTRAALDQLLSSLRPGVTEVVLRPAIDTAELRAVLPDWAARVADHDLAMTSDSLRVLTSRPGVHLLGYRALRDLQRRKTQP
jgi:predicted glycoside hydrolase/deacetylase ChbG (UPF0249 family)